MIIGSPILKRSQYDLRQQGYVGPPQGQILRGQPILDPKVSTESVIGIGPAQVGDQFLQGHKISVCSLPHHLDTQGHGQMGFAYPGRPEEDDVGCVLQKARLASSLICALTPRAEN